MQGNRGLSVLAGIILGAILGFWIYSWPGYFLISGPIQGWFIPTDVRVELLISALLFGAAPGVLIGIIGGLTSPFHYPRGHMAKSIGAFAWIPITALAWLTQWYNLAFMSGFRIAVTVVATIFSFALILPISEWLGTTIEKIREK